MRGLIGNTASQPRVFGHDAVPVVIGAINNTAGDGGFIISNGGTNFVAGDVGSTMTAASGNATFTITSVSNGAITGLDVVNLGSGYAKSGSPLAFQPVALTGGTGSSATFTVTNIDIPNTEERGCVLLHVANSSASVGLIMESGNPITVRVKAEDVVGHQCPLLVKRVTAGSDLVAIY